jgi:ribose 5-phosphate isomerase B
MAEDSIRRMVADAVKRKLQDKTSTQKLIIDADTVNKVAEGGTLTVPNGAIITPLAQSALIERHIRLAYAQTAPSQVDKVIAIGADHGGFSMKEMLKNFLQPDYVLIDCGTSGTESVDYPDFALAVAEHVSSQRAGRGIMIDGAGIGSSMVANKVPGVRAALCYDQASAHNSREHNDANVLTLGAGMIGMNLAQQIVTTWLNTPFAGGRHAGRVNKIIAVEKRYLK